MSEISAKPVAVLDAARPFNDETKFGIGQRLLLVVLAPVTIIAAVAFRFIAGGLGLAGLAVLPGIVLIFFGLWMPIHALFGCDEQWQFEASGITRLRRNWIWKGKKTWPYADVKGVRVKPLSKRSRPELLTKADGWLPLPEQVDAETAERLKTMIGDYKRATMVEGK